MTRTEAIEILKGIAEEANESKEAVCYVATDEDIDALNMAIKALEQLSLPRIFIGQGEKAPSVEPKRGEKAKTLFINLYNCEKFVNLSNGFICMKIPKCSIYDENGSEVIVNCVRQDNFECCFTNAFERVERIEGE